MTDTNVDEFAEENPPVQEEEGEEEEQQQQQEPPVYVWAVVMLQNGEIKLVTELPFEAQRKALMSDVSMTGQFIVDAIKNGTIS